MSYSYHPWENIMAFRESMISDVLLDRCAYLHRLTQKERNVIMDLARGKTQVEMACDRGLNAKTISQQKRNAFLKMQVRSDVACIHYLYFLESQFSHSPEAEPGPPPSGIQLTRWK